MRSARSSARKCIFQRAKNYFSLSTINISDERWGPGGFSSSSARREISASRVLLNLEKLSRNGVGLENVCR